MIRIGPHATASFQSRLRASDSFGRMSPDMSADEIAAAAVRVRRIAEMPALDDRDARDRRRLAIWADALEQWLT